MVDGKGEYPVTRAASGRPFRCLALRNGKVTILDATDYEWAAQWKWSTNGVKGDYVCRNPRTRKEEAAGLRKSWYLHRKLLEINGEILGSLVVDHINRNPLDNRRCNLRAVSQRENIRGHFSNATPLLEWYEADPIDPLELEIAELYAKELSRKIPPYSPIPLTKGRCAIVSPEDYEWAIGLKWYCGTYYAERKRRHPITNRPGWCEFMHRAIVERMGINVEEMYVDHINGDKFDNRRENLRVCTQSQNVFNQRRKVFGSSGKRGVRPHQTKTKGVRWASFITVRGYTKRLGTYDTAEEAEAAHKKAAAESFGEYSPFHGVS